FVCGGWGGRARTLPPLHVIDGLDTASRVCTTWRNRHWAKSQGASNDEARWLANGHGCVAIGRIGDNVHGERVCGNRRTAVLATRTGSAADAAARRSCGRSRPL